MTFEAGFMMAESAEIGRLIGWEGCAISMITTCANSPTRSRTHVLVRFRGDCIEANID